MDVQLKRGLLDVCVLSVLKDGESYGYKIIADLSEHIVISESTLYPILKRLEQGKFVTTRTAEHNGRLRKYYMITQKGKQKIEEFLQDIDEFFKVYDFIRRQN
ncbi:MAG: PadR family transcriptional regulator [Clostridia bacterium]|nr:PadR family transcriptional regulator [Clostridia bacterium]